MSRNYLTSYTINDMTWLKLRYSTVNCGSQNSWFIEARSYDDAKRELSSRMSLYGHVGDWIEHKDHWRLDVKGTDMYVKLHFGHAKDFNPKFAITTRINGEEF